MDSFRFHCLIVDTTAFINNVSLKDYAEFIITVPEVINEIKNKRQLKRLCVLPYELTVDEPTPESVKYVIEFAKKTGDYLSLSIADIKIIALTYQLEKELFGSDSHLRKEPIIAKTIASRSKPIELLDSTPIAGFYKPLNAKQREENAIQNDKILSDHIAVNKLNVDGDGDDDDKTKDGNGSSITDESGDDDDDHETDEVKSNAAEATKSSEVDAKLADAFDNVITLKADPEENSLIDNNIDNILVAINKNDDDEGKQNDSNEDDDDEDEDEDGDGGWITPNNIATVKSEFGKDVSENKNVHVACMSTDYAIQNVLKQMNLNIVAIDGKVIKQLRTYILRCYACYKTTSIMTKIFCPKCGNKTLKRVAVSLDENGQQVIYINTRRPLTAKWKNKSVPRIRGGKHSSNPILYEDQPIPKQMPSRVARTKTNALEEDYIAGYSPFAIRDINSKSAMLRGKCGGTANLKQIAVNHEYKNMLRDRKK